MFMRYSGALAIYTLHPFSRSIQTSPIRTMASDDGLLHEVQAIIPALTNSLHKGQAGRIGVIGGSVEYTGAPYFAAISSLKVGCDLSHVFCIKEASQVIKSYSPELIVHPILDSSDPITYILEWESRLHTVVIGPGLGRDPKTFDVLGRLIQKFREMDKPIIIDADALAYVTDHIDEIKGYTHAILTPNAVEFNRLCKSVLGEDIKLTPSASPEKVKELATALGHVTIVNKGASDIISNGSIVVCCTGSGCTRRCGGQGDVLAGALATFYHWALNAREKSAAAAAPSPEILAAYGACRLTRECSRLAFSQNGRSTTTSDLIRIIHQAFSFLYGP